MGEGDSLGVAVNDGDSSFVALSVILRCWENESELLKVQVLVVEGVLDLDIELSCERESVCDFDLERGAVLETLMDTSFVADFDCEDCWDNVSLVDLDRVSKSVSEAEYDIVPVIVGVKESDKVMDPS